MRGIINEYARPVPIEALMASRNERHSTDIAGLRGVRFASAIEIGKGRSWDEPKVLLLTGGDKISARLMRQDNIDFYPRFKLWIAGNHKPGLRAVNEAIRRRVNLTPFTVVIPKPERDRDLGEKLKAEWPGILAWMIKGCLEWQRIGLAPPAAVTAATDEYLASQDLTEQWIEDCCDRQSKDRSSVLYGSWKKWCEDRGEFIGHQRDFNATLEQKGFRKHREEQGEMFYGLQLKPSEEAAMTERMDREQKERGIQY
jgi:putative DNA primase/helicase